MNPRKFFLFGTKSLGEGAFGQVLEGKQRGTGTPVAIKKLKGADVNEVREEVRAGRMLRPPLTTLQSALQHS